MAKRNNTKGNPTVAIGYLRVSTGEQDLGIPAQRAAIEAWAAREGVEVVGWHEDRVSGGTELEARPGLVAAIGAMRAARAGVLAIAKRDRLARDTLVAGLVERAVKASGGVVVCADGAGNGEDAASAFMRSILDAAAAYERAMIRSRTKAALSVKKSRGQRVGSIPFGFQLAKDGKMLAEHEGEQHVIRIARELHSTGMSLRAIGAELESRGLRARNGTGWAAPQIQRMVA